MFKLRPPKTKYHAIWDVQNLLEILENISLDNVVDVSRKIVYLFMVSSGSRVNTISKLKITNTYLIHDEYTFIFDELLKYSRPSYHEKPLVFRAFPENPKLCPVTTLKQYSSIRLFCSSDTVLLITSVPLYKGVSSDTIEPWIKKTMEDSGINSGIFSSHSCQSISTSKLLASGVSVSTILEYASSSTDATFKRHSLKYILGVFTDPFKRNDLGTELFIRHSLT